MKIFSYPSAEAEARIQSIINRGFEYEKNDIDAVNKMLADVKARGDDALMEYSNRFDAPGMKIGDIVVTAGEIESARNKVDASFFSAMSRAASQIESFHRRQLGNSWFETPRPGVFLGQMINPVSSAGIYVPGARGGTTPLVSSVLMGGIPAKIAGVEKLVMVTPPTPEGGVNPHLLVAAEIVGVDRIYKVGSAWAIAALTYGTKTVESVDVIVGPGNIYVTLAKKMVSGIVGTEGVAGPSEILVIADNGADPEYIAADLLSQAEHDALASAVLVAVDADIARGVVDSLETQVKSLPRSEIARESLANFGMILVAPDIKAAIEIANRIAPEHLELQVRDPFDWIGAIRNAGAIFIGGHTPEPVGDYIAGPNHVLPTNGTARFSSALSVDCFMKKTSIVYYTPDAFYEEAEDAIRIAEMEGLEAHAESLRVRLKKKRQ